MKPLLKMYRFQSMGEFRALLSLYNIGVEEVKGEVNGCNYHGILYSALNKDGKKNGTPIKSSVLGKSTGIAAIEKQMQQSGTVIKDKKLKERTRRVVSAAIQRTRTESDFRKELSAQGIDLVLRRNEDNRIYGVTFIDHRNRVVLNGSRLGKDFSANVFNEYFRNAKEDFCRCNSPFQPTIRNGNHRQMIKLQQRTLPPAVSFPFSLPIRYCLTGNRRFPRSAGKNVGVTVVRINGQHLVSQLKFRNYVTRR